MGSSFQNLVAPTRNLGTPGDRAPIRQQPCKEIARPMESKSLANQIQELKIPNHRDAYITNKTDMNIIKIIING